MSFRRRRNHKNNISKESNTVLIVYKSIKFENLFKYKLQWQKYSPAFKVQEHHI
jgi:hypothetical protein